MSYPYDGSDHSGHQPNQDWQQAPEDWGAQQQPGVPGYSPGADPYAAPAHHTGGYSAYRPTPGPTSDEPSMALAAHLGGLLTGFLVPLIIYMVKQHDSQFVRHHAAEALNFQITVAIASVVSAVLMFVLIGFLTIFVVAVLDVVLCIMAAVAANRGEWYRYPVNIRMVN